MPQSFELIINNATHLTLEHQIAWYAHFELGRLLTRIGGAANQARARDLFQTIIEARVVLGPTKGKGKVSLQSGIILKANAARKCSPMPGCARAVLNCERLDSGFAQKADGHGLILLSCNRRRLRLVVSFL